MKFVTLFKMLACLALLALIGGPILLGIGATACYIFIRRGERFVRAYFFLMTLNTGASPEAANYSAHYMPTTDLGDFALAAKQHAQFNYGNNRMLLVKHAKQLGFHNHK